MRRARSAQLAQHPALGQDGEERAEPGHRRQGQDEGAALAGGERGGSIGGRIVAEAARAVAISCLAEARLDEPVGDRPADERDRLAAGWTALLLGRTALGLPLGPDAPLGFQPPAR
jgi:hypothetical protein